MILDEIGKPTLRCFVKMPVKRRMAVSTLADPHAKNGTSTASAVVQTKNKENEMNDNIRVSLNRAEDKMVDLQIDLHHNDMGGAGWWETVEVELARTEMAVEALRSLMVKEEAADLARRGYKICPGFEFDCHVAIWDSAEYCRVCERANRTAEQCYYCGEHLVLGTICPNCDERERGLDQVPLVRGFFDSEVDARREAYDARCQAEAERGL